MNSTLTRANYNEYLMRVTFGSTPDLLSNCITRAYRDVCRTIHGLGELADRTSLDEENREYLYLLFSDLATLSRNYLSYALFDKWHESACENLREIYVKNGYSKFTIGQAQKWINMTFKYIFVHGEELIPGFQDVYPFCHVPIDNVVIAKLQSKSPPLLLCPWSRVDDYAIYLQYQKWIRREYLSTIPLDVEFKLWLSLPILGQIL